MKSITLPEDVAADVLSAQDESTVLRNSDKYLSKLVSAIAELNESIKSMLSFIVQCDELIGSMLVIREEIKMGTKFARGRLRELLEKSLQAVTRVQTASDQ